MGIAVTVDLEAYMLDRLKLESFLMGSCRLWLGLYRDGYLLMVELGIRPEVVGGKFFLFTLVLVLALALMFECDAVPVT